MSLLFLSTSMLLAAGSAQAAVKGTVTFKGAAPAESAVNMASDPKCKALNPKPMTSDYAISAGKVAGVVVYLKKAPPGEHKVPSAKVQLDQKGCAFVPKAFGIMVGQELEVLNSDPTLHNVHAYARPGEFNQAMPKQGLTMVKKFKKPQVPVDIKCDVHKWMHASAIVLDHPFFATTNDKGEFSLHGVPDGEYEIEAYHAKLGTRTGKVKVAGGNGAVDFAFGG